MTIKYELHKCLQFGLAGLLISFTVSSFTSKTQAQQSNIVPDSTLGAESSQVIDNFGGQPIEVITGGAIRQINLFHSFKEFNISEGREAYFFIPNANIQNVLARVTGNNPSEILGRLGTFQAINGNLAGSNANLFLINPNGIIFGQNAQLELQGAFTATTANSVVFPNGVEFSTTNSQAPSLLAINVPIGLQFGSQPGSITNQSVNFLGVANSTLALVGGEITLDSGGLFASNGQVKLAAVGGNTTVGLDVNGSSLGFNLPGNLARSSINLRNRSIIGVTGNSGIELFGRQIHLNGSSILGANGGSIGVNATQLSLDNNSSIQSFTSSATKGGDIQIQASDAVTLANSSRIFSTSNASATGTGGDVSINAGKITITGDGIPENSGLVSVLTVGAGNGGNLTLNATESVNINGGFVSVGSGSTGKAGNLTVRSTDTINVTDQGTLGISSTSSGSTGNLRIETGTLRVQNTFPTGGITATTASGGSVGSISIQARDAVDVTNGSIFTGVRSGSTTQATAGDITIETRRVNLKDGGSVSTSTFSSANAANIFIQADEYVNISGVSSTFFINTSKVSSDTGFGAMGNGGNVTILTPRLTLTQGGKVSTSSVSSNGKSGNITIRAKDVELDGFVFIPQSQFIGLDNPSVQTVLSDPLAQETLSRFGGFNFISQLTSDVNSSNANVQSGTISIETERLRLSNGGNITTSVLLGGGQGGNLEIHATDTIDISGVGPERLDGSFAPSGLFADLQTGGIGNGGNIDVKTGRLNLSNEGQISASTFNQGNAGNITIHAEQINMGGSSSIITQVNDDAIGNAGNINITTQLLNVQEQSQISSATQGNGNAGNLTIQADTIALTGSDSEFATGLISSVDEGANGKGGDIDITTKLLFIRDNAEIVSGSIGTGDAGNIRISANTLEIDGKGSGIASFTNAGNGGDIILNIDDLLLLRRGALISTTAGRTQAGCDGGNININSRFIIAIPGENSDITANAFTGTGGKVEINSQGIFGIEARPQLTEKSDITASSELGIQGLTNINAPDNDSIETSLTELPNNVIDTNALIANSCIARSSTQQGTFIITGTGSLPHRPGEVAASSYPTGDVQSVTNNSAASSWKKGEPIVEPQGVYRLANGDLVLSRECL
ncbi:filamentous hemagglutinin outer membrane protein (plasmid) [Nostoc sp. NIES-2111]|nr:filamentous hemagglutinin outer membrane protein [Nostoc sp. NIES-2111]